MRWFFLLMAFAQVVWAQEYPARPVTVPPTVKVFVVQVTLTPVTLAAARVPLPLATAQV